MWKCFQAAVLVAAVLAHPAAAGESERLRIEVTWVGGATMVITFGDLTILTDPALGADGFRMGDPNEADLNRVKLHRRLTPFRGVALETVDLVLLSHAHEDHFDQVAQSSLDRAFPILLPPADVAAVKRKGFEQLDALDWGETRTFDAGAGQVKIIATPARHSRDPQTAETLGVGNGYWIEFTKDDWKRAIYWTGDTFPVPEVVGAVRSRGRPDVMIPHVGGVGAAGPLGLISMEATDVVALADALQPRWIFPIHHSTYAFYREPIGELVAKAAGKPYSLIVGEGATIMFD